MQIATKSIVNHFVSALVGPLLLVLGMLLLLGLTTGSAIAASPILYFAGELELQVNGELINYRRFWKCEPKTQIRPAQNELFKQHYVQVPVPRNFIAIRSDQGRAVIVDNWIGCKSERDRIGAGLRQITIYDRADDPSYGEILYTKLGAPAASVPNPTKRSFHVRVIKDSRREIGAAEYQEPKSSSDNSGTGLLNRLIQKAAYSLTVEVISWNTMGKTGVRTSLSLTEDGWVASDIRAPALNDQVLGPLRPPHNKSLYPLPLQASIPRIPKGMRVLVAGQVVELDGRGFGEITPPPSGLSMARVYASVDSSAWSLSCTMLPGPECPKPLP
ncbi:hypothetical protein [Roseateles saccharophilus]|uniref:Uncharacterized protein n=1 Tax=Roseateles saccharophilus TaxID=304 RepID=A0A4R3UPW6_ROSSA|nr:hypothetical protein [Roseateles saccharophilus]MDG0833388.1 hypothetical protein [Roseateles saccharophilus]TCU93042.1 hypothetical protein EV671_10203 [Roseateles saccharophilus]